MTVYELKLNVQKTGSTYFGQNEMRFFGDSMENYGVRKAAVNGRQCYELYRKKPVHFGLQNSVFFDAETFKRHF